jgi:ABC-type Zn uptake system ZnuABC Zn-binding protein ZnuA
MRRLPEHLGVIDDEDARGQTPMVGARPGGVKGRIPAKQTNKNEIQYCHGMLKPRRVPLIALLAVTVVGVVACGSDDEGPGTGATTGAAADRAPHVVATTTQVADLVRNVAGDGVQVTQLLAANADPHGYELRPRDVEAISAADLVIGSGGDLDDWLDEAIEQSGADANVVALIDSVETLEGGHGHEEAGEHDGEEEAEEVDPHWWQDPQNAVLAVGEIERALAVADPARARAYADRAERYRSEIEALDLAVAGCWDEVPAAERKLVTTHDALGYYARRYDLEVIGTVIPSLSTQGQASAGELAELAEAIRDAGVRVVFAESSVNSKVERAIADEAGAEVGKALWADTLGPEGSDGATYLESIASNTRALVGGVTGGAVSCRLPVR